MQKKKKQMDSDEDENADNIIDIGNKGKKAAFSVLMMEDEDTKSMVGFFDVFCMCITYAFS